MKSNYNFETMDYISRYINGSFNAFSPLSCIEAIERCDRTPAVHGSLLPWNVKESIMTNSLKKGAHVSWKSHGGETHGKVVRKLTKATTIKGHKVAASDDNPEYLVETDEGKRAAHKPGTLHSDTHRND